MRGGAAGAASSGAGGDFDVTTTALFVGQGVCATGQAAGELESLPSVELTVVGESRGAACSDGIDNDGDTFVDCADFSCNRSTFVTVCETTSAQCDDNMDNDGNGFKDCDDRNCENTAACR